MTKMKSEINIAKCSYQLKNTQIKIRYSFSKTFKKSQPIVSHFPLLAD